LLFLQLYISLLVLLLPNTQMINMVLTGNVAGWASEPIWTPWRRGKIPLTAPSSHSARSLITVLTELQYYHFQKETVQPVKCLVRGWTIHERDRGISLRHCNQIGPGDHPTSHPKGKECSFSFGKAAEAWSWPI